ncbi:unnamed protein product, partial [Candidula unifasciata]
MDLVPQDAAVDLKKKNTNRSANTRVKDDGHGPLQSQPKKYSDKTVGKLTNKQNNELLNSSRPGSLRESPKGSSSSKDGWSIRKDKQNNREHASLAHKTNRNASPASLQKSISDSCDPREGTKSQMHPLVMKNQKHSAESVGKSDDPADTSRQYNSRNPPVPDSAKNDGKSAEGKKDKKLAFPAY